MIERRAKQTAVNYPTVVYYDAATLSRLHFTADFRDDDQRSGKKKRSETGDRDRRSNSRRSTCVARVVTREGGIASVFLFCFVFFLSSTFDLLSSSVFMKMKII